MKLQIDGLSNELLFDEDKVNNGVWVQLEAAEPDDAGVYQPLYLNGDPTKPQRVRVRSYRCKAIIDAEQKMQRDGFVKVRLARGKNDKDKVIAENSLLPPDKQFGYFLVAVDNFSASTPGVQQVAYEDAVAIHGMASLSGLVQKVRETSYDDALYLVEAGSGKSPAPAPSSSTSTKSETDTGTISQG